MDEQKKKLTKDAAVSLLINKQREIGTERLPVRSDFTESEVMLIKSHLGPWPRALETAGLKAPRDTTRLLKNREKRRRAKIKRREEKLSQKENSQ